MEEREGLIDGKYTIEDLIDIDRLCLIFERINHMTEFAFDLLKYPGMETLVAGSSGGICSDFHKACPATREKCFRSNSRLLEHLRDPGQVVVSECENGLMECVAPIVIKCKRVATLVTGQILTKPPVLEEFRARAKKYGFDEQKYLEAVRKVPVIDKERLKGLTEIMQEIALIISELGYANLQVREDAARAQEKLEEIVRARTWELEGSRSYLDSIINSVGHPIFVKNRQHSWVLLNDAYCEFMGYSRDELIGKSDHDFFPQEEAKVFWDKDEVVFRSGTVNVNEEKFTDSKGITHTILTKKVLYTSAGGDQYIVGVITDITARVKAEEALKESEARFRAIYETTSDAMMLLTAKGFFDCNPRTLEMFQVKSVQDFSKLHPSDISPPFQPDGVSSFDAANERIQTAFREGSNRFEWMHRRQNGEDFPAEVLLTAFTLKGEQVLQATVRDITRRKRAEEKLRESEAKFKVLFDDARDGVLLADVETKKFTLANKAICQMLGYSEEELVSLSVRDIHPEADLPHILRQFDALANSELKAAMDLPVKRKDGTIFYADIVATPIMIAGKRYSLGNFRDITERKLVQEALVRSERRMDFALQAGGIGVWELDLVTGAAWRSSCHDRIFGYEKMLPKWSFEVFRQHVFPEDRPGIERKFREAVANSGTMDEQCRIVRRDGAVRWIWVQCRVEVGADKKPVRVLGLVRDVTDRKNQESLLIKSELIQMVSHELRTPLYPIREGIAMVLEDSFGALNDEQRDILSTCESNVGRLVRLVDNFLDFQKFETGVATLSRQSVDMNELVREVFKIYEILAGEKGLLLEFKPEEGLPQVSCDRDRIVRALTNLLHNALKFTPRGKISVQTSMTAEGLKVAVSDTGVGIRKEDQPLIFTQFGQLEEGKKLWAGGTGLGLVITKKIIDAHGGRVWVESEFGKGSVFSFVLPMTPRTGTEKIL